MNEWQPIATVPMKKWRVLVYDGVTRIGFASDHDGIREWKCETTGRIIAPTHWMPLPDPPSEAPTP